MIMFTKTVTKDIQTIFIGKKKKVVTIQIKGVGAAFIFTIQVGPVKLFCMAWLCTNYLSCCKWSQRAYMIVRYLLVSICNFIVTNFTNHSIQFQQIKPCVCFFVLPLFVFFISCSMNFELIIDLLDDFLN